MPNGFQGFSTTGGFKSFGSQSADLSTSAGLYNLAQQHGGAVAQSANEIMHPTTGILSTISDGFKKSFSTFVDTISLSSEVVAGILSPTQSVSQAIKDKLRVSDVLFGKENKNMSTMQKVGDFFVRTAVDILTDPLTYVSFGASSGILGLKSLASISLGEKATKALGIATDTGNIATKAVSKEGSSILAYLRAVEHQMSGVTGLEDKITKLKGIAGPEASNAAKELESVIKEYAVKRGAITSKGLGKEIRTAATDKMIKNVLDSKLRLDFTKQAMSRLLENKPELVGTLIDKGGIKMFGNSIVSGQAISDVSKLIPGMSALDKLTSPIRGILGGMFNPNVVKVGANYSRLPEEYATFQQTLKDLNESKILSGISNVSDILNANEIVPVQAGIIRDSIATNKLSADPQIANATKQFMGIDKAQEEYFKSIGMPISHLDMYTGNILAKTDMKNVSYFGKSSGKIGTAEMAKNVKFISQSGSQDLLTSIPEAKTALESLPGGQKTIDEISKLKSPQEASYKFGDVVNSEVGKLVDSGMPMTEVLKNKKIMELMSIQQKMSLVKPALEKIGNPSDLNLVMKDATGKDYTFFENNKGTIFKRVAATSVELKKAGIDIFDTNFATAYATKYVKNINQGLTAEFLQNAGIGFGKVASEAPSGWVNIPLKKVGDSANIATKAFEGALQNSKGEEMLFHPAIAKGIEDMFTSIMKDPATNDFLKGFDKIQRYWKASVTSVFPAFHGRNAISNVFLNFLDLGYHALNPATSYMAVQLQSFNMKADKLAFRAMSAGIDSVQAKEDLFNLFNKKVFTDASGYEWSFGELRHTIKDSNIAFSKDIAGSLDIQGEKERFLSEISNLHQTKLQKVGGALNVFNQETFVPMKYGKKVGSLIEGQARLVNFISNLRATGDVAHAAARTKQFLFDYGNLTTFEKNVMRRIIPFYSFMRKNLELQVSILLSTPGRTAAELTALINLGSVISGGSLTPEQKKALPDWIKSGIDILKSNKGNNIEIYNSLGTPIEQPFQAFQFNQLLGSVTPIIRLPVEQMSGYSFFRGKMLTDITNASAFKNSPKVIKDLIGFTKVDAQTKTGKKFVLYQSLRPEMMNLVLQLPPTSRVFSTMRQIQAANVSNGSKLLQQLIGLKPYSFDIQQQQAKKEKELRRRLEDMLNTAGIVGKYNRVFIPKNQK